MQEKKEKLNLGRKPRGREDIDLGREPQVERSGHEGHGAKVGKELGRLGCR